MTDSRTGTPLPLPPPSTPRQHPLGRPHRITGLAAIVAGLLVWGMTRAQELPRSNWALVIGISRYVNAEPLRFAASDAREFSQFLQSPRGGSFDGDHVITLLEDQATRFRIFSEFESLQDEVQPGDTVYIYLAGHGIVNRRGIGYFVPSDGDPTLPAPTSVPFSFLKELVELGLGSVKNRVLITDLCHSGRIGPETSSLSQKIQNLINQELLGLEGGAGGFLNLLGSRPTEPSWERDDLGGGVFSHVLLEGLNGEAAEPGTAALTAEEVVDYVITEVPRFTANQQHPMVNQDFDRSLALAYPTLPGPEPEVAAGGSFLTLIDGGLHPYDRIEWVDPISGAQVIRKIPSDAGKLQLGPLEPGIYTFRLAREASESQTVEVDLSDSSKTLDLDTLTIASGPPGPASLFAGALPPAALTLQGTVPLPSPTATLVLRLSRGTEVRVDQKPTGAAQLDGWVRIEGLAPGSHRIDLIPDPEREYRYRLDLFRGSQLLDWETGQLRPLAEEPRPLDADLLADQPASNRSTLRAFEQAIWNGDLVDPPGQSAADLLESLRGTLPPRLEGRLSRRLLVAMGDKAQRFILQYLRGGDIHWRPETFEEGTELLVRVQSGLRENPILQSEEHFFRGRALLERGSLDRAETELRRSAELNPDAGAALNALGLVFWRRNRLETAAGFLERALQLNPEWTYPRNTLALIRMEQRRYLESEQRFRESISLDPRDSTAVHGLGQLQLLRGDWEEAERSLLQAVEINPGNAYAHHTLGVLYLRQLRFEDAESRFRLAIRLEPDEPAFRISLGDLLRRMGRIAEADGAFGQLLDREPASPEVRLAFADHLAATDRFDEGAALVDQAVGLQPDRATLYVRAGLYWLGHDKARARSFFEAALRRDRASPYALYNLALLDVEAGRTDRADERLRRALAADSRYPAPYLLRARLLAARGRTQDSIELLETGLQLSVEPAQKQEFRQELRRQRELRLDSRLADARRLLERGRPRDVARLYSELYRESPDSRSLRDALLDFDHTFPGLLPPLEPAGGVLARVLRSSFWSFQRQAFERWGGEDHADTIAGLIGAVERLELDSPLRLTSFNLDNATFSLHAILLRWADRLLKAGEFAGASSLLAKMMERRVFAPVPNFSPLTIDSLMVPDDGPPPQRFPDFEVAFHPDRRVHEALAVASAGRGDIPQSLAYLAALETNGPDLELRLRLADRLAECGAGAGAERLLRRTLSDRREAAPSDLSEPVRRGYLLLAAIQLADGRRRAASRTLDEALALWPTDPTLQIRRREVGEDPP